MQCPKANHPPLCASAPCTVCVQLHSMKGATYVQRVPGHAVELLPCSSSSHCQLTWIRKLLVTPLDSQRRAQETNDSWQCQRVHLGSPDVTVASAFTCCCPLLLSPSLRAQSPHGQMKTGLLQGPPCGGTFPALPGPRIPLELFGTSWMDLTEVLDLTELWGLPKVGFTHLLHPSGQLWRRTMWAAPCMDCGTGSWWWVLLGTAARGV